MNIVGQLDASKGHAVLESLSPEMLEDLVADFLRKKQRGNARNIVGTYI